MSPRRSKPTSGFALDDDAARKLTDTPKSRALLEELGQAAVYNIRRVSPEMSGRFKRSIDSEVRVIDGRPMAVVYTRSPVWHLLEYGRSADAKSGAMAPRRPFARGLEAMGIDYRRTPKG